jgi:hypothetical protein
MATENKRGNRETKKPKAPKVKTNASAPSTKGTVLAKPASTSKK